MLPGQHSPGLSPRCPARSSSHGRGEAHEMEATLCPWWSPVGCHRHGAGLIPVCQPPLALPNSTAHPGQLLTVHTESRAGLCRDRWGALTAWASLHLPQPRCKSSCFVFPLASGAPAGCGLCSAPRVTQRHRQAPTLACMCGTCKWNDVQASVMLWLPLLETE